MAKAIICKKCGTTYSSALTICPNCMCPRPKDTRTIILLVISCIAAVMIFGVVGSIINEESSSVENGGSTKANAREAAASRIESQDNEMKMLNVGDTLDANGLKITFQEVSDWKSDNMFIQPKVGYKYIRAYFIMKNTNDTDRLVGSYDFTCYADNAKMESVYYGDDTLDFGTISSGRNLQGYVYFEVPENAQSIEIEYETSWWTDKKAYFKIK